MYYQTGTVSNEFFIFIILVTREYTTIYEKNHLFEQRRDLINVGEGNLLLISSFCCPIQLS